MKSRKSQNLSLQNLEDSWHSLCQALIKNKQCGKNAVNNWILKLKPRFEQTSDQSIVLLAPNSFIKDWVKVYYLGLIQRTWLCVDPKWGNRSIYIGINASSSNQTAVNHESTVVSSVQDNAQRLKRTLRQISDPIKDSIKHCDTYHTKSQSNQAFDQEGSVVFANALTTDTDNNVSDNDVVGIDDRFMFDNFVVDGSNEFAYHTIQNTAESKKIIYNPLFIYGDVGLGKTHLMHALGNHLRQNQDPKKLIKKKVIYMTAERFMYEFVTALRLKNTMGFKQKFRSFNVLMIDDIQFIAGKESTQNEFFHTFNALFDNRCQIVISADRFPAALHGIEERIKSRLGGGLVLYIKPANYELRLAILQHKLDKLNKINSASNRSQIILDKPVMAFLANTVTSIRELEGSLNRILAYNNLCRKSINVDFAREILSDLVQTYQRIPTVEEVKHKVAEHYSIKFTDLSSGKRYKQIVRPRQVAIYLCKKFTNQSLNSLGKKFGGRDHSTIKYAISVIDKLMLRDSELMEDITSLNNMLQNNYSKS